MVKDILSQNGPNGKRGKWISSILEYKLEIKHTKLIEGQGLAKLMVESNFHAFDIKCFGKLDDQEEQMTPQIDEAFLTSPWYEDLIFVLFDLNAPLELTKIKAISPMLKAIKYCIIDKILY